MRVEEGWYGGGGHLRDRTCPFKGKRREHWSVWSLWCRGREHKKGLTHRDALDDKLSYSFKSPHWEMYCLWEWRWIYPISLWLGLFRANKNHSNKPVIDFKWIEMAAWQFCTSIAQCDASISDFFPSNMPAHTHTCTSIPLKSSVASREWVNMEHRRRKGTFQTTWVDLTDNGKKTNIHWTNRHVNIVKAVEC